MLYQRALATSLFIALAACSSSSSDSNGGTGTGDDASTPSGNSPQRKTVTCDDVQVEESHQGTYKAGDWGTIPAALQALPAGASFCGSTSTTLSPGTKPVVVTHIVSTIWDQDIYTFYNPLVTKLGCTLQPMDTTADSTVTVSRTSFTCTDGSLGTISATEETQYMLTYASSK